jgi:uncharacterized protein (TIGR02246 family)
MQVAIRNFDCAGRQSVNTLARCLIFLSVAGLTLPLRGAGQSQDEAEICNVQRRQQEAWNRHDAKAYADLFAEGGDVVNVVGWWWRGRPEIEGKLTEAYKFVFRESTLTIDEVHVRFLTPEIAVAHVLWSMSGAKTPPGIPEPRKGIQTQVLQKQAGKWLIASFQNTNAIPETPFPAGPPSSSVR